jgi:hypothetical protein
VKNLQGKGEKEMKANFKIHTRGMTGEEIRNFTNAIETFFWENFHQKVSYGFLPVRMVDVLSKEIIFTLCGRKGLNRMLELALKGFVHGYCYGRHPLYSVEWV